jgi:hypothetical protein
MKRINFIIILLVVLSVFSLINLFQTAQAVSAPEARWEKIFSSKYDRDFAQAIQTHDNGYLIAGAGTWGDGVIKTNQDGDEMWNKTFDGTFLSVQQTSDDKYIIAGHKIEIDMFNWSNSYYLIKLLKINLLGEEIWKKSYSRSNYIIEGNHVSQTNDGGYIIVGNIIEMGLVGSFAIPDAWLIKTDSSGNMIWNKTYGGKWNDTIFQVLQTKDNGYIMVGSTDTYGLISSSSVANDNVWLVKTDETGNEQWNKTFGGKKEDVGYSIQQTNDGGFIVAGFTRSYGKGDGDVWLIKTGYNGNMQWNKTFDRRNDDRGYCVLQVDDEGYVIAGVSYYNNGDVWLIKTDSNGNMIWNKTYGSDNPDRGYSVSETSDGGYILSGRTFPDLVSSDIMLIKLGGSSDNRYPISDAGGPYSASVGDDIIFDASGSSDPDGEIKYFRWDWNNDGIWDTNWLTSSTVKNSYWNKGSYNIVLEVKDNKGGTNSTTTSAVIGNNIEDNKNEEDTSGTPGFEIILFFFSLLIVFVFWKR